MRVCRNDLFRELVAGGGVARRRLLGLDVGETRVGIALTDPMQIIASPEAVLLRRRRGRQQQQSSSFPEREVAAELSACMREHGVAGVVCGWPLEMSGRAGTQCAKVLRFLQAMHSEGAFDDRLPVTLWDERQSTKAVREDVLFQSHAGSRKRREQRREVVDKLAAAYILQGFLDSCGGGGGSD